MRLSIIIGVSTVLLSCSKKTDAESQFYPDANYAKVKYDTTAIDSFSPGATPNNMKPKVLIIKDTILTKKEELEDKIKTLEKQKESDKEKDKKKKEEKVKEQEKPVVTEQPE